MKRILMSLFLMGAATAVAQSGSGTYDVTCEGVVVGEATVVDGAVEVVWEPDVQCETPYAVDAIDATLHFEADGSITLVFDEEAPVEDEEPVEGDEPIDAEDGEDAEEDGKEDAGRLTGLDRADEAAGENGAHGRARARAAQGVGEPVGEGIEEEDVEKAFETESSLGVKVGAGRGRR